MIKVVFVAKYKILDLICSDEALFDMCVNKADLIHFDLANLFFDISNERKNNI